MESMSSFKTFALANFLFPVLVGFMSFTMMSGFRSEDYDMAKAGIIGMAICLFCQVTTSTLHIKGCRSDIIDEIAWDVADRTGAPFEEARKVCEFISTHDPIEHDPNGKYTVTWDLDGNVVSVEPGNLAQVEEREKNDREG